jgi:hypothetical protein
LIATASAIAAARDRLSIGGCAVAIGCIASRPAGRAPDQSAGAAFIQAGIRKLIAIRAVNQTTPVSAIAKIIVAASS